MMLIRFLKIKKERKLKNLNFYMALQTTYVHTQETFFMD